MSFSSDVKQELCRIEPETPCCLKAELAGLLALSGVLLSETDGGGLRFPSGKRRRDAPHTRTSCCIVRHNTA